MTAKKPGIPVLAAPAIDPGNARVEMTLPEGMTLADIVATALPGLGPDLLGRVRVALVSDRGSAVILQEHWHAVRPNPGVRVVIRLIPGKSGLRAVLSIVVAIAAVAAGAWVAGAMSLPVGSAAYAVTSGLVGLGVNLVGALLINALIPPVKPEDTKPNYTLSGWRNRMDPDGAVPVVLGRIRYAPPFAARSYTEVDGDRQYVRAFFVLGEGPLSATDFRIGETSISDYDEVEIEVREGLVSDLPMTLCPHQVLEEQIGVDLIKPVQRDDQGNIIKGKIGERKYKKRVSRDEWIEVTEDIIGELPDEDKPIVRTTGADAAAVNIILAWPAGLVRLDDEGERRNRTVNIRIEQRLAGAEEWQPVTELAVTARTTQTLYRQHSWSFPTRGRWQIRCTMLTLERDDEVQQRTVWAAIQTLRPEYPIAYPYPLALVAVRVKATHQLSGALDNFSAVVSRRCLDWDRATGTWILRATSNPASLFRFILQAPFNPRRQRDDQIDLEQLQDWHDFCREKELHYNRVLDQAGMTMREARAEIAAAGRASPRHDGQRWGVVIDRPTGLIVDHINPLNSWDFSLRRSYTEKPHAWIVPFNDEENDFREAKRIVPAPGHTGEITLTEELSIPGLTNARIVYREATRRFHEAEHRPDVIQITQDGLLRVATRGDKVALNHYVLRQTQQVARVRSTLGQLVELDEIFTMVAGRQYALRFRVFEARPPHMAPDTIGTSVVRPVRNQPGESHLLSFIGDGPMPDADDLVHFGIMGEDSFELVVTNIEATTDQCAILRAVASAPIIDQLTDATVIPPWSGRVGAEIGENTAQPPAPRFSGISFGIEGDPAAITFLLTAGSGSVGTARFEIEHRPGTSGAWTTVSIPVANGGGEISGYETGETMQMRARAISLANISGPWTAPVTVLIGGSVDLPAALDSDAISITPLLGGALIQLSTGEDTVTARIQVYRASWDLLYRETDAMGAPHDAAPLQTLSIPLGDTTRANLINGGQMSSSAAWTLDPGWNIAGGLATHTAGTAGGIRQNFATTAGKWYRLAFTVSGRTAGTITPRLTGGSDRPGQAISANGYHLDRIQAVTGNNRIEFVASADFNGSITGIVAYLETAACLTQGEHFIWLEPQTEDGVPGPVSGPFVIDVV